MNIILPIHPRHCENIFSGKKRYELRKSLPKKLKPHDIVFVYETAPTSKIVGYFYAGIETFGMEIKYLFKHVCDKSCISKDDFFRYFKDKKVGFAIRVIFPTRFKNPIDLSDFGFKKAPQNFYYTGMNWSIE